MWSCVVREATRPALETAGGKAQMIETPLMAFMKQKAAEKRRLRQARGEGMASESPNCVCVCVRERE